MFMLVDSEIWIQNGVGMDGKFNSMVVQVIYGEHSSIDDEFPISHFSILVCKIMSMS